MIKKPVAITIPLLVAAFVAGCSTPNNTVEKASDPKITVTTEKPQIDIQAKNRPKTKKDTIMLEGMKEEHSFTLADSPSLEFTTYIDEGLVADIKSTNEGDSLFVYANFAGKVNKDAMAHIFARTKGAESSVDEMSRLVKETVEKDGFKVEHQSEGVLRYEFSEEEFGISKKEQDGTYIIGHVSVFKRSGRVYWLIVKHLEDYEEGFIPRIAKMVEDIVWYSEGQ